MNASEFQAFKSELAQKVEQESGLVGLVFLGSASDGTRQDQWSDHDFFLIAQEGLEESYRQRLDWLPDSFQVSHAFRDTDHGLQVISSTGHLLEYAVFSEDELYRMGRVNAYTLMVDKGNLAQVLEHCARERPIEEKQMQYHVGKVLACAIIAMGRYARGERASGREVFLNGVLRSFLALYKGLPLLEGQPRHPRMDNLDVFRRVETTHPDLGRLLDELESLPVPRAVERVLDVQLKLCAHLTWYPTEAHHAVQKKLEGALKLYI